MTMQSLTPTSVVDLNVCFVESLERARQGDVAAINALERLESHGPVAHKNFSRASTHEQALQALIESDDPRISNLGMSLAHKAKTLTLGKETFGEALDLPIYRAMVRLAAELLQGREITKPAGAGESFPTPTYSFEFMHHWSYPWKETRPDRVIKILNAFDADLAGPLRGVELRSDLVDNMRCLARLVGQSELPQRVREWMG